MIRMGTAQALSFCEASADLLLRLIVCLLSIAGLVLLVKDHQSTGQLVNSQYLTQSVKYSYTSAFLYLVYTNGVVAIYCFLAAVIALPVIAGSSTSAVEVGAWIIFVLDQALTYVLLAAASASSEVAYLADKGNAPTAWEGICSTFDHFCRLIRASVLVSFLSVLVLAIISMISARRLFRKYKMGTASARKDVPETGASSLNG